jgi:hypothetical protein
MPKPKSIKVIHPRTDADLEELKRLDAEGKLASGNSYPKAEKNADENMDEVEATLDRLEKKHEAAK